MLRVLTFNTWLLRTPFRVDIAEHVDERCERMPQEIRDSGADIVFLQECWSSKLRRQLKEQFKRVGYPYCATTPVFSEIPLQGDLQKIHNLVNPYRQKVTSELHCFPGGHWSMLAFNAGMVLVNLIRRAMGNGLMIFSRYPLDSKIDTLYFSQYTRPDEFFVVKGAVHARCQIPSVGNVDLYNSHLGAVSYDSNTEEYHKGEAERRLSQTQELVNWITQTRTAPTAFLGVDLNSHCFEHSEEGFQKIPSKEYALMNHIFQDPYRMLHPQVDSTHNTDSINNPYKAKGHFKGSPDGVLDYVFSTPNSKLEPHSGNLAFTLKTPNNTSHPLSDHFGVVVDYLVHS